MMPNWVFLSQTGKDRHDAKLGFSSVRQAKTGMMPNWVFLSQTGKDRHDAKLGFLSQTGKDRHDAKLGFPKSDRQRQA